MVPPAGVEPAISWMRTRYPRPLDDGGKMKSITNNQETTTKQIPKSKLQMSNKMSKSKFQIF